jgi:hypothetical protein
MGQKFWEIAGFALLIVGTIGLLATELTGNWNGNGGAYLVETFAVLNLAGLIALTVIHWLRRRRA